MQRQYLLSASILGADFLELGKAVKEVEDAGADLIQLDIADGNFVPTISFGEELVRRVRLHTNLPVEVHLMVARPQDWFDVMGGLGVDVILFHTEVATRIHALVEGARKWTNKVGVVLNTETSPEAVRYILPYVDVVMTMGILPGFSGQGFVESVIGKLGELRGLVSSLPIGQRPLISLDGGVTEENAARIVGAGADILVASSAFFKEGDPVEGGRRLRHAIDSQLAEQRPWVAAYRASLRRPAKRP